MLFREPRQPKPQSVSWPADTEDFPTIPEPRPEKALEAALQRIEALEFEARRGAADHERMWAHISRLERQLGTVLASQLERRDDLAGTQHCEHQDLSQQTRTLVEQQCQNFARQYADKSDIEWDRPHRERTAYLMSVLIRQLLTKSPASSWSIQQTLRLAEDPRTELAINRLRSDCVALMERIAEIGLTHEWNFDHIAGRQLDQDRQEAWGACDPQGPASFVVAPAYLVNGRVYGRQLVYTA